MCGCPRTWYEHYLSNPIGHLPSGVYLHRRQVSCLLCISLIVLALSAILSDCSVPSTDVVEILIRLKPEQVGILSRPQEPDPMDTGIASLDSLNRKWNVRRMVRVFPNISSDDESAARHGLTGIYKLVVPPDINLAAMVRDYRADPNIAYAEPNQPATTK